MTDKQKAPEGLHEVAADDMADAPPERPYGDAITDEHRAVLEAAGVPVEPKSKTEPETQD